MCYFLYGAINEGVDLHDCDKVMGKSDYKFHIGTKHDVKMSVASVSQNYRITAGCCDCDTPIGSKHPAHKELRNIAEVLTNLKNVRGVKCVYLCKNWAGKRNKGEETVHIDDLDIPFFLANLKESILYRIDLFQRF